MVCPNDGRPAFVKGLCRSCYHRAKNIEYLFGITQNDYDRMYREQKGLCAVCGEPCATGRKLAIDHDHKTRVIRGLLCSACNNGLGRFRDNPELLRKAADYLDDHRIQEDNKCSLNLCND